MFEVRQIGWLRYYRTSPDGEWRLMQPQMIEEERCATSGSTS